MSNWPFRFVHAADLHLEMLPFGLTEAPDHLRDVFIDSAYRAAERVFDTVLAEQAEFLVLAGDVLDPALAGPRGPLFLVEQFTRLADRRIPVYWVGGRTDPPDAWPAALPLPQNVHLFRPGRPQEFLHRRDDAPLVRVLGASANPSNPHDQSVIRPSDFEPDTAGLFSIAVAYGQADPDALAARGIHYWALGGRHTRTTLLGSPSVEQGSVGSALPGEYQRPAGAGCDPGAEAPTGRRPCRCVAHYPGTHQGRRPEHAGPHGCTVVHVDPAQQARTTMVPTDVLRWRRERITVDPSVTPDHLATLLHGKMQALIEASPKLDLLVSWTVTGSGPLVTRLRRDTLASELLAALRQEFGFGAPAAWSVSLSAEPEPSLPPEWYEPESIRGAFLRAVQQYQMNPDQPLELDSYLSEAHLAGTLASLISIADEPTRREVLREVALLGADLLSGEDTQQ